MYWNTAIECMDRGELEALQLRRFKEVLARVYERVPLYKRKFDEAGFVPASVKTLEDLKNVPFTYKADMRESYPFDMFAVPLKDIVRIHASSGTTGKSTVVGYTRGDIDVWAELMARTLANAGTTSDDVVHNAYGYGLFTGGLGVHYGAEKMGASVVPISGGNTKRQVQIMADFQSTILACTPSYSLYLAEAAVEAGYDPPRDFKLRAGVFGAEPWSEGMRKEIERNLGIKAIDIYGLSEVIGPGVAAECLEQKGLHVNEDHFLVEVIDPDTGEPVEKGRMGELVFTSLTKEAIPIIRYRTRDISVLLPDECACGRSHVRMARVSGRTDDMLIIRGVNVFPSQIESVLLEIEETAPHYLLVIDRQGHLDTLECQVEVDEKHFTDEIKTLEALQRKIKGELESVLQISVEVKLVEPKTIQRSEGKAKRVIDKRQL